MMLWLSGPPVMSFLERPVMEISSPEAFFFETNFNQIADIIDIFGKRRPGDALEYGIIAGIVSVVSSIATSLKKFFYLIGSIMVLMIPLGDLWYNTL